MLYLGGDVSVEYDYWAPSGVRSNQYSELVASEVTRELEQPNSGKNLRDQVILKFILNRSVYTSSVVEPN